MSSIDLAGYSAGCKFISLTQGQLTLISPEHCALLCNHMWFAMSDHGRGRFYAVRNRKLPDGRWRLLYMHRLIMETLLNRELFKLEQVDHINGNALDNRAENLRLATTRQNAHNSRKRAVSTSRYKGVYWNAVAQRWAVRLANGEVLPNGHRRCRTLGYFDNEIEAAHFHDVAARKAFGPFARLNFPGPGEQGAVLT